MIGMTKPRKYGTHYPRFTWLIRGEARITNGEGMTKSGEEPHLAR